MLILSASDIWFLEILSNVWILTSEVKLNQNSILSTVSSPAITLKIPPLDVRAVSGSNCWNLEPPSRGQTALVVFTRSSWEFDRFQQKKKKNYFFMIDSYKKSNEKSKFMNHLCELF